MSFLADTVPGSLAARLLAEHAAMRPLLRDAVAAPDAAKASTLLALVGPHAALEDEAFARLLPGDPWTDHVLGEHAPIEAGLRRGAEGDAEALRGAARLALGHFNEEERHVLPRIGGAA